MRMHGRRYVCRVIGLAAVVAAGACEKEEEAASPTPAEPAATTQPAAEQPAELPPGHPPVAGQAAQRPPGGELPPGHPPTGKPAMDQRSMEDLPPGHPPIRGTEARPPAGTPETHPAATQAAGTLSAAGIDFTVPDGWAQMKPASALRLAQYSLPGDAGAAELTVFCFGPGQGGSGPANIERWVAQFKDPANPHRKVPSEVSSFEQNGLKVTVVRARGTYVPGAMSMRPMARERAPEPDHALYGLIVENGPKGNVFVKVTGPAATIDGLGAELDAFGRSARPAR